jgi:hypothetical protein
MVCEDQVPSELPAAAERPDAGHGSERPLRQSGFLNGASDTRPEHEASWARQARRGRARFGRGLRRHRASPLPMPSRTRPERLRPGSRPAIMATWTGWRSAPPSAPTRESSGATRAVVMLGMSYAGEGDPLAIARPARQGRDLALCPAPRLSRCHQGQAQERRRPARSAGRRRRQGLSSTPRR